MVSSHLAPGHDKFHCTLPRATSFDTLASHQEPEDTMFRLWRRKAWDRGAGAPLGL